LGKYRITIEKYEWADEELSEPDKSMDLLDFVETRLKELNLSGEQALDAVRPIVVQAYEMAGKPNGDDSDGRGIGRWIWEKVQSDRFPAIRGVIGKAVEELLTYNGNQ
jgi:hypothetical protein